MDAFRARSTRLVVAYLLGGNASALVVYLSLAIAFALDQMFIAFIGLIVGIAAGIAVGFGISNAVKRLQ